MLGENEAIEMENFKTFQLYEKANVVATTLIYNVLIHLTSLVPSEPRLNCSPLRQ